MASIRQMRTIKLHFKNLFNYENPMGISILLWSGALILRFIKAFQNGLIVHDGILYIKMARIIATGDLEKISEYSFFNLYPVLVALFYPFIKDWELSGRLVSAVLGASTVVPLFLMIRKMVNSRVAFMASLLYVVSPHFVEYSSNVLRESSFWFFSIMALWLAWEGIAGKKWWFISLSSIFAGLSVFTRIEGLAIIIVILLWIPFYLKRKDIGLKKVLISLLIFMFSFPVLISPSLWILKSRLGRWELGQMGGYLRNVPSLLKGSEEALNVNSDLLSKTPIQFRSLVELSKRYQHLLFLFSVIHKFIKSYSVILFLLLLFGLFRRRCMPFSKNEWAFAIWFAIFFIISFLYVSTHFYFSTRHGLLMGFPALVWSGLGFWEVKGRVERWTRRRQQFSLFPRYAAVGLFILVLVLILAKTLSPPKEEKIVLRKVGTYLKAQGFSGLRFAGQPELTRVAFYADSDYVLLPPGMGFEEIMKFIKQNQVSLLLVDERTISTHWKQLRDESILSHFERVQLPSWSRKGDVFISIYEVQ